MALDLIDELEALVAALSAGGLEYAVCGGLALGIHGHPRMTKDIDLLVREEDVQPVLEVAKLRGFDIPGAGNDLWPANGDSARGPSGGQARLTSWTDDNEEDRCAPAGSRGC